MKSILFITTSSLASNPRLVKEVECLKAFYKCYVVCFIHHDWSFQLSEEIKSRNSDVEFIEIDRKKSYWSTIFSKLLHKAAIVINPLFKTNFKISAFASNDKTPQLVSISKQLQRKIKFSRVIAHNLGSFYPAVSVSERQKIDLQLDIEDFYPGEALYFNKVYEKANRHNLMQSSFNKAKAITYASKGIEIECKKAYKYSDDTTNITIINAFEHADFVRPKPKDTDVIKCVWFSQNIGPNRGLEQVFDAAIANPKIKFHLIGNANNSYIKTINPCDNIVFHNIMPQKELHEFLSNMDIGMALEHKDADFNRNICLTNKFLAYAQAGLYILATDTFGQTDFLNGLNYDAGQIINTNLSSSLTKFDTLLLKHKNKVERWENAKAFSWERERELLLQVMK